MGKRFTVFPIRIDNQNQARDLLQKLGVWAKGIDIMAPKAQYFPIKVGPLSAPAAQILKQEMLSKGGEAASHGEVLKGRDDNFLLLCGTLAQYQRLLPKLTLQPFGLAQLAGELEGVLKELVAADEQTTLQWSNKELSFGRRTLVMGILNLTPDSFSDGGCYSDPSRAVERALEMESQGADIIDIGAESTRPGFDSISSQEEAARLLPVVEKLAGQLSIPISIDTYKPETARAALDKGGNILNDVFGSRNGEMNQVAAEYGVPYIMMHNQRQQEMSIVHDLVYSLEQMQLRAIEAGVREEYIILDPGIGFGKTLEENLEAINRIDSLKGLGSPILVGTSRKDTIGKVLGLPAQERLHGTSATVAAAIMRGADIVRVHDVEAMVQVAKMTDAILGRGVTNG